MPIWRLIVAGRNILIALPLTRLVAEASVRDDIEAAFCDGAAGVLLLRWAWRPSCHRGPRVGCGTAPLAARPWPISCGVVVAHVCDL